MTSLPSSTRDRSPTEGSDCGGPHSSLFEYGGGPSRSPASILLVILHYLLKNNMSDFNTRCCKNQLGESPDDPPKNAWGAWPKWEDQR